MTFPGQSKHFLIGKETTFGTGVSATRDIGIVTEISDDWAREIRKSPSLSSREVQSITGGMFDSNCSVTVEFQHGRLLEFVFGSVAHVETTGDWKHTFTIANGPPSMSAESADSLVSDVVKTYAGLKAASAELNVAINEVLTLSVDFEGQSVVSSTSAGTSVISSLPVFEHSFCNVTIDGTAASEVQNFTVSIPLSLAKSGGIGSAQYQQIHSTGIDFEFTGTLGFTSEAYQEIMLGGSGGSTSIVNSPTGHTVILDCHNGVTLGSGRREFYLELGSCVWSGFTESASVNELVFVDVSGTGTLTSCFSVDNISSSEW